MSLRSAWKEYFTFSRKERNGAFFLLFICCLLIGWLAFNRFFYQPESLISDKKFREEAAAFEARLKAASAKNQPEYRQSGHDAPAALFPFNPNEINDSTGQKLGMPHYLASRIRNYVDKGGRFRIKKDLLRIYGMDSSLYARLEPYITLPDSLPGKKTFQSDNTEKQKPVKPAEVYDLNTCTFHQLTDIKGIGEWRANQILNYRNRLGGFIAVEQLLETGAVDTLLFDEIKKQLSVSTPVFRKISLKNFECRKVFHPYLPKELCREIERKLFLNPHVNSMEELKSKLAVNDSLWHKLLPYLSKD